MYESQCVKLFLFHETFLHRTSIHKIAQGMKSAFQRSREGKKKKTADEKKITFLKEKRNKVLCDGENLLSLNIKYDKQYQNRERNRKVDVIKELFKTTVEYLGPSFNYYHYPAKFDLCLIFISFL